MSEGIKNKIGEELYNQIIAKGLNSKEFGLYNGWVPIARFDEVNGKVKSLEGKIASYETQITDTQALLAGNDDLKQKYAELQNNYSIDLAKKDKEIANVLKTSLVRERLTKEGAKHTDLLLNQIDLDKLSVDNNNLLGADEIMTNLKATYGDLFIQTNVKPGTTPTGSTPPANDADDIDWETAVNNLLKQ